MKVSHLIVPPIRHLLLVNGHVDSASIVVINTSFMIVPRPHKQVEWGQVLRLVSMLQFPWLRKNINKGFLWEHKGGQGTNCYCGVDRNCVLQRHQEEGGGAFFQVWAKLEHSWVFANAKECNCNPAPWLWATPLLPAMPLSDIITDAASKSASRVKSQ